jgi:hypothetical protein
MTGRRPAPPHPLFRYAGLRAFLERARDEVGVLRLCDWAGQAGLVLRHDVDLDLWPAHRLAQLEREVGVRSSFFVAVSLRTYNPAAEENRRILREMAGWGFEIGLHFDASAAEAGGADLAQACRREADWLSEIVGRPVTSMSLHNPSASGSFPLVEGFRNAYDPVLFTQNIYLSDSRMVFRRDPEEMIELARHASVQLLLHPMHFSESGAPYPASHIEHCLRWVDDLHSEFCGNSSYAASVSSLRHALGLPLQPEEDGR